MNDDVTSADLTAAGAADDSTSAFAWSLSEPPPVLPPTGEPSKSAAGWRWAAVVSAVSAVVAVVAVAAVVLWPHRPATGQQPASAPSPAAVAAPSTVAAAPSTVTVTAPPPAATVAQPSPTVPPLGYFAGYWTGHERTLVIRQSGTGHFTYADTAACPSCSLATAPVGTVDFTLTSVSNDVASGNVDASSDEQQVAVGAPITVQFVAQSSPGRVVLVSVGTFGQLSMCDKAADRGQCGA